jgi:hypothetical protein
VPSKHLSYLAALGVVVYALMQIKEEHDWSAAYATEHDCRVIETSDSREWASVGLTGHPRVGASAPREKWRCADGTVHWRDKF